jgi:hypothetical protein
MFFFFFFPPSLCPLPSIPTEHYPNIYLGNLLSVMVLTLGSFSFLHLIIKNALGEMMEKNRQLQVSSLR